MQLITLAPTDRKFHHATHKVIFDYNDIAAMGAVTNLTTAIFPTTGTFPAGVRAMLVAINLVTAFDFSDASINSLTLVVGDGGVTNRLLDSTQLAADGSYVAFKASAATTQPYAYVVADTIDALFTCAGGASPTLAECTSGKVEIYLWVDDLNLLENTAGSLT